MLLLDWFDSIRSRTRFAYQVTVTAGQATTPKFAFASGAPAAFVDWGDGTAASAVTSGAELNHTYASGGTYRVRLVMPNQRKWVTQIDISSDKVSYVYTPLQQMRALTQFLGYTNGAWAQNISSWVLPSGLTNLHVGSTSVSGNISSWVLPSGLAGFYVTGTSVSGNISSWVLPSGLGGFSVGYTSVSGDISSWVLPSGLTYFAVNSTSVSGTPSFASAAALATCAAENRAAPTAQVDAWVSAIYQRRAAFTAATPTLTIGGTNQAPSGVYQNATPPTTGKEYIYKLVNDPDLEGFKKWSITYTA